MTPAADAAYFARLSAALDVHAGGVPRLVVDVARLDANVGALLQLLRGRRLRLVVKSLPSLDLLERVASRADTRGFMCFHPPFLPALFGRFPGADVLMGKPVPLAAVERAIAALGHDAARVAWLVDDLARLDGLLELAARAGRRLRVAIELDVGLHRGGVADESTLGALVDRLASRRDAAELAGFMGYDAHVAKAPWPGSPARAAAVAGERYAALVAAARRRQPDLVTPALVHDGAGSPTVALHATGSPVDDVAVGSALVKPCDFDLPGLEGFAPAAWIATPVLKVLPDVRVPFLEGLTRRLQAGSQVVFVYGGRWLARPAWPAGLRASRLYGLSSNQQFHTLPRARRVAPGDWTFFRPTQSEAVLLQFGPLLAVHSDGRVDAWPVLDYLGGDA